MLFSRRGLCRGVLPTDLDYRHSTLLLSVEAAFPLLGIEPLFKIFVLIFCAPVFSRARCFCGFDFEKKKKKSWVVYPPYSRQDLIHLIFNCLSSAAYRPHTCDPWCVSILVSQPQGLDQLMSSCKKK